MFRGIVRSKLVSGVREKLVLAWEELNRHEQIKGVPEYALCHLRTPGRNSWGYIAPTLATM